MKFRERSEAAKKILAEQPPVSYEQLLAQVKALKERNAAFSAKRKGHDSTLLIKSKT